MQQIAHTGSLALVASSGTTRTRLAPRPRRAISAPPAATVTEICTSTQAKYDIQKSASLKRWIVIVVEHLGSASGLLPVAKDSPVRDGLLTMPVAATAASTLHKHLDVWDYWASCSETPSLPIPIERAVAMLSEFPF